MKIRRGDIIRADFSPVIGSEQGGERYGIVVQNNVGNKYSPTIIVVCITSQLDKPKLPTHVSICKNDYVFAAKDSIILVEQIRVIDKRRVEEICGRLRDDDIFKVDRALLISVGLNNSYC